MSFKTRNRAIAQAHYFGANRCELAKRYGLTPRRISQIIAAERFMATWSRRDAWRAMRNAMPGRPRLPIPNADRALYAKARRYYGAAYARELLGVAA